MPSFASRNAMDGNPQHSETMTEDLFPDVKEVLSPRLAWMQKHSVTVRQELGDGQECDLTGEEGPLWVAWAGDWGGAENMRLLASRFIARASSEEEALIRLAFLHGIKLWNES